MAKINQLELYEKALGFPAKGDPKRNEVVKNSVKGLFRAGLYDYDGYRWNVAGRAVEEITKDWDAQKFEHAYKHGLTDEERSQVYSLAEKYQMAATGELKRPFEDPKM